MGFFLHGLFIGSEPRNSDRGGFVILVSVGVDAYRVTVPDVPAGLALGSPITVKVRPSCFNNRIYYSGEVEV